MCQRDDYIFVIGSALIVTVCDWILYIYIVLFVSSYVCGWGLWALLDLIWSGFSLLKLPSIPCEQTPLRLDNVQSDFNDVLTWWVPSNCYVELCSGCTCICVTVFWLACNCLSRYCASCVFSLLDSDCCLQCKSLLCYLLLKKNCFNRNIVNMITYFVYTVIVKQ